MNTTIWQSCTLGRTIRMQSVQHTELGYLLKTEDGRELLLEYDTGPYHEMRCFQYQPWQPILRMSPSWGVFTDVPNWTPMLEEEGPAIRSHMGSTLSRSDAPTDDARHARPVAVVRPTPGRAFLSQLREQEAPTPLEFRALPRYLWRRREETGDTERTTWQRRHNLILLTGDELNMRRRSNTAVIPPRGEEIE